MLVSAQNGFIVAPRCVSGIPLLLSKVKRDLHTRPMEFWHTTRGTAQLQEIEKFAR